MSNFLKDLDRPVIMGILNVTPDSFSDGGQYNRPELALQQAFRMIDEGADIIDIGGESTRPGADAVSVEEELERVIPVIESLRKDSDVAISIDTSKAAVMREAVHAGAGMINDVAALAGEGAIETAAASGVPVCLMHMQGEPRTMQQSPEYPRGVVQDVMEYLLQRVEVAERAGISRDNLVIDPGFGFGKTLQHNFQLLEGLAQLQSIGLPILVGMSRKSMIGNLLGVGLEERLAGSLAAAVLAMERGAS
ncbi:MAG TPA: dihydropteroate synthase, partial [Gammaproteobacteria bacterium]